MKKKIIIFTAYFHPHNGGSEKYIEEVFQGMKGYDITVVTGNTENAKRHETYRGMNIIRLPCWHIIGKTYPVMKLSAVKEIFSLGKNKYDYVITNTRFFNISCWGKRFAKKFRIPHMHIEHGTTHVPLRNPLMQWFAVLYDHTIGWCIIKNSKKTIAISKASESFVKHLSKKTPTRIVYNSIDTSKFVSRNIPKTLNSLKIKEERVIVFVGRVIHAKGIQDLISATEGIPDLKILIIGEGNYRKNLESMSDNLIFVGEQDAEGVIKYLAVGDIFVNPSYAEGLPTSVLEAGAMGLPIIATDVGGTKEIIQDGVDGYLVKPHDVQGLRKKIITLLEDEKLREKFSSRISPKIRSKFDWSIARKEMKEMLD